MDLHSRNILFIWIPSFLFLLLMSAIDVFAQKAITISGIIVDAGDNNPLPGATIYHVSSGEGTVSNPKGKYKLEIPVGNNHLRVSFIGYEKIDTILLLNENKEIKFALFPKNVQGEEVQVISSRDESLVEAIDMGTVNLKRRELNSLPTIMGEADPIKVLQLLPGIQGGSEIGAGFNVRGGGVDQNLILFDNALVYNPGHLLGFFSVFNPDIISDVTLRKSGISAEYGGRLSSVMEINSDSGEKDSTIIFGNIGLISSRAGIAVPLFSGKGSIIVAGRATYFDAIVKPIIAPLLKTSSPFLNNSKSRFFDTNFRFSYRTNKKDYFSVSGYAGNDTYSLTHTGNFQNTLDWGNSLISGNWGHVFNDKFHTQTSLSYSRYNFNLTGRQGEYFFNLKSGVEDYRFQTYFAKTRAGNVSKAGIELHRNVYTPNKINAEAGNFDLNFTEFNRLYALEGAIFYTQKREISNRIGLQAGLRYSIFNHLGPYQEYNRNTLGEITDTISYRRNEPLRFYHALEPRLSVRLKLRTFDALKFSFMRMAQYTHLATSSSVSMPTDIWLPSSKEIKPQKGFQLNTGYYLEKLPYGFESSIGVFYKSMSSQLEFTHGIIYNSLNNSLYDNLATGSSQAYGAELQLRKNEGRTTGWISYTLSRVEKKFDEINEGLWYPATNDRRHDLSLVALHRLSEKWSFSAVFVFVSGKAFTLPVARYVIQGNLVNDYDAVNGFRMPAYHRMDISASRKTIFPTGKISEWNFSIYNIYNRQNPFYIYFQTSVTDNNSIKVKANTVYLFPVIPSVSWKFKF